MKNIFYILCLGALLSSCVTQKKYDDLNIRKRALEVEKAECEENLLKITEQIDAVKLAKEELEEKYNELLEEHERTSKVLKRTKEEYDHLEDLHDRLTKKYSELLNLSSAQSTQLSSDLARREQDVLRMEKELRDKRSESVKLQDELAAREARVKELEGILADQQKAVEKLKAVVSNALLGFKDSDLTVEMKNGKVYVSLAEQLLFKSGSKTVDKKGVVALKKLAVVLKGQRDLNIQVEGHTDDVDIIPGTNGMKDNWDLSVLRATEITRILTSNGVNPKQVSASGRSEYLPVNAGKTKEARAKNRRTEIILTPKLDELFKILE